MSKSGYKQKVCIIVNHENTILLFRKEIITALLEHDYSVYVLLPAFCDKTGVESLGASVRSYELKQFGTNIMDEIKSIRAISTILADIRPDIVFTYTIKPNLYGGAICRFRHIPYIATITGMGRGYEQNGAVSKILSLLLKFSLKKAKKVVFQNKTTQEYFTPRYVKQEASTLVNGSGVDLYTNQYEPYPDNERIELLFVGRATEDKGIRELFEAVQAINRDSIPVRLTVVGPVEQDCEVLAKSLSDNPCFAFKGMKSQSEVHDFIKNCDAVVVPSYHEGMCNALLEAAATGRPVITTRIPGCMETFDEGSSGIGCEPRDTASLKDAIVAFTKLSRGTREQMGFSGRKKMEQEFDRRKIIQTYIDQIK